MKTFSRLGPFRVDRATRPIWGATCPPTPANRCLFGSELDSPANGSFPIWSIPSILSNSEPSPHRHALRQANRQHLSDWKPACQDGTCAFSEVVDSAFACAAAGRPHWIQGPLCACAAVERLRWFPDTVHLAFACAAVGRLHWIQAPLGAFGSSVTLVEGL